MNSKKIIFILSFLATTFSVSYAQSCLRLHDLSVNFGVHGYEGSRLNFFPFINTVKNPNELLPVNVDTFQMSPYYAWYDNYFRSTDALSVQFGFTPFSKKQNKLIISQEILAGFHYANSFQEHYFFKNYYSLSQDTVLDKELKYYDDYDELQFHLSYVLNSDAEKKFNFQAGVGLLAGASLHHTIAQQISLNTLIYPGGLQNYNYYDSLSDITSDKSVKVKASSVSNVGVYIPLNVNIRILKQMDFQIKAEGGLTARISHKNFDLLTYDDLLFGFRFRFN